MAERKLKLAEMEIEILKGQLLSLQTQIEGYKKMIISVRMDMVKDEEKPSEIKTVRAALKVAEARVLQQDSIIENKDRILKEKDQELKTINASYNALRVAVKRKDERIRQLLGGKKDYEAGQQKGNHLAPADLSLPPQRNSIDSSTTIQTIPTLQVSQSTRSVNARRKSKSPDPKSEQVKSPDSDEKNSANGKSFKENTPNILRSKRRSIKTPMNIAKNLVSPTSLAHDAVTPRKPNSVGLSASAKLKGYKSSSRVKISTWSASSFNRKLSDSQRKTKYRQFMGHAKLLLDKKTITAKEADWTPRMKALKTIRVLVREGLLELKSWNRIVKPTFLKIVTIQLEDLRAAIIKEVCGIIMEVCERLGSESIDIVKFLFPLLSKSLYATAKVISISAHACLHDLVSGVGSFDLFEDIMRGMRDAHAAVRQRCVEYLGIIMLASKESGDVEMNSEYIIQGLVRCLSDGDPEVRQASRKLYFLIRNNWQNLAGKAYENMASDAQRAVKREETKRKSPKRRSRIKKGLSSPLARLRKDARRRGQTFSFSSVPDMRRYALNSEQLTSTGSVKSDEDILESAYQPAEF
eukprot:CAMPEP_0167755738 /NCGR_PEP_ID=MMETSP0110_2-20121227/8993_1 /TAXON_ID=629695 /ORGANISM="Gymnochlora sp., Strain CCMP2014" /LENGTH=579 /DNA_ID=CAMNT_0007641763 /DNA_START=54 /DNA_END=1794 /DNA_ORIENTATION=+